MHVLQISFKTGDGCELAVDLSERERVIREYTNYLLDTPTAPLKFLRIEGKSQHGKPATVVIPLSHINHIGAVELAMHTYGYPSQSLIVPVPPGTNLRSI